MGVGGESKLCGFSKPWRSINGSSERNGTVGHCATNIAPSNDSYHCKVPELNF